MILVVSTDNKTHNQQLQCVQNLNKYKPDICIALRSKRHGNDILKTLYSVYYTGIMVWIFQVMSVISANTNILFI